MDNGIREPLARATVEGLVKERRAAWTSRATRLVFSGIGLLAMGALSTLYNYVYSSTRGSYVVMAGALAAGGVSLMVGIYMLVRPPEE